MDGFQTIPWLQVLVMLVFREGKPYWGWWVYPPTFGNHESWSTQIFLMTKLCPLGHASPGQHYVLCTDSDGYHSVSSMAETLLSVYISPVQAVSTTTIWRLGLKFGKMDRWFWDGKYDEVMTAELDLEKYKPEVELSGFCRYFLCWKGATFLDSIVVFQCFW